MRYLEVKYHIVLTNFEQECSRVRTKLDISSFPIPEREFLGPQENAFLYQK